MEVIDFFGDFLENASLLLDYVLDAFSMINIFNPSSPIYAGIRNGLTNMGITINALNIQSVLFFIGFAFYIGLISFAVGIFLRIAGSR